MTEPRCIVVQAPALLARLTGLEAPITWARTSGLALRPKVRVRLLPAGMARASFRWTSASGASSQTVTVRFAQQVLSGVPRG